MKGSIKSISERERENIDRGSTRMEERDRERVRMR